METIFNHRERKERKEISDSYVSYLKIRRAKVVHGGVGEITIMIMIRPWLVWGWSCVTVKPTWKRPGGKSVNEWF